MKSAPKILNAIFISIFVMQLISLLVLMLLPTATHAQTIYKPLVTIDGSFQAGQDTIIDKNTLGKYIRSIYQYAIGVVGILAAVVLMYGGFKWLIAGGNPSAIGDAQDWIKAALTGLVLTMTSYLILATVNPALVNLSMPQPQTIGKIVNGCCQDTVSSCSAKMQTECTSGVFFADAPCGASGKCDLCASHSSGTCNSTSGCYWTGSACSPLMNLDQASASAACGNHTDLNSCEADTVNACTWQVDIDTGGGTCMVKVF